jgi:hypothetical protein
LREIDGLLVIPHPPTDEKSRDFQFAGLAPQLVPFRQP